MDWENMEMLQIDKPVLEEEKTVNSRINSAGTRDKSNHDIDNSFAKNNG